MSQQFDKFLKFMEQAKTERSCKKTNKYGSEIIRINQNARAKLQRMVDITKISKRGLVSYAIFLLHEEFEKWLKGDPETQFGYDKEIVEENQNAE